MNKPTKLQRELIGILKRLGGKATTREISEASGRDESNCGRPRIGTGSTSFSLGQARDYVKYLGMASKGNAIWELVTEPEPPPTKEPVVDPQGSLGFDET
ncbi:MAG: hypothetical protein AAB638_01855 [Patescibacteria group bacterium]